MPTLRESLLATLAASRELEEALVAACDDSPPDEPDRWTAKDHLVHLAVWREHVAGVLDAVRRRDPVDPSDVEERNARIFAENRGRPAAEVLAQASASYGRLARAIEDCSDEDLRRPRGPDDQPVWRYVPGTGIEHLGQHLVYWHLDRGDQPAAEGSARAVYEIATAGFDEPHQLTAATYNLGCFYATMGRTDEAVALVNEALAREPGLREWAMQDPDLVSVNHLLAP